MKSILNLLLIILMSMVSILSSAQSFKVDSLKFSVTSAGRCKVIACYKKAHEIVIPSQVSHMDKELTVVSIGKDVFKSSKIHSVTLPDNLESIGWGAFRDCKNLKILNLPESCYHLESEAFSGTNIRLYPMNVTDEDRERYDIIIPQSISYCGRGLFSGNNTVKAVKTWILTDEMFKDCTSLEKVDLMSACNIPHGVFQGCKSLSNFVIPEESTEIGIGAFAGTGLKAIDIPENITIIPEDAFHGSELECVTGCEGITDIEEWAFFACYFKEFPYMPALKSIRTGAFACTSIETFVFGRFFEYLQVPFLGDGRGNLEPFHGCTSLKCIISLCNPAITKNDAGYSPSPFEECNIDFIDVHVPKGMIGSYKSYKVWQRFNYFYDDAEEWLEKYLAAGVEDVEQNVEAVRVSAEGINIENGVGKCIAVYDLMGRMRYCSELYDGEDILLGKGMYILMVDGKASKIKI